MEYYNNVLCVSGTELINTGLLNLNTYKSYRYKNKINVLRRACFNTPALIEFDSLPKKLKETVTDFFGNPDEVIKKESVKDMIKTDPAALKYYSDFLLADGRNLPLNKISEYTTNASILNWVGEVVNIRTAKRKALNGSTRNIWQSVAADVESVKDSLKHTLPANPSRLKAKFQDYKERGYIALVHKGFCNDNSRKVNTQIESLILSLYSMNNRPFAKSVFDMYNDFVNGKLQVVNVETGELFDRANFIDEDGAPIELSEVTIKNYINNPVNRALVDSQRMGRHEFNGIHRPHHHRHRPNFSLSKISMDDRDLPRKMENGNRVKAYYAYDLASGAVIGAAYSLNKDKNLILDCFRSMFQFLDVHNLGMPLECEVEQHLMSKMKDDLNALFKFVRFCAPGNSQEKGAEHLNRAKKYSIEKKNHNQIGRWWAKCEAYRVSNEKVNDEFTEERFSFAQLVAEDKADIEEYNNSLHPKQKTYKGLTRLDVLFNNVNPDLQPINRAIITKIIGEKAETSIRRNQYLQAQYNFYEVENPANLMRLKPGNYDVDAYYLRDADGSINNVFVYQGETFISRANIVENYNEAKAEQTAKDKQILGKQSRFIKGFDNKIISNKPGKVEVLKTSFLDAINEAEAEIINNNPIIENNPFNEWNSWGEFEAVERALNDI